MSGELVVRLSTYLLFCFAGLVSGSDERVVVALEELTDLKGVWSELSKVWEKIEELKEKPWLSVAPRKIRQALDALVQQLRGFPTRLKSYASFEYVQATLKGYAKVCIYVCGCDCCMVCRKCWYGGCVVTILVLLCL